MTGSDTYGVSHPVKPNERGEWVEDQLMIALHRAGLDLVRRITEDGRPLPDPDTVTLRLVLEVEVPR